MLGAALGVEGTGARRGLVVERMQAHVRGHGRQRSEGAAGQRAHAVGAVHPNLAQARQVGAAKQASAHVTNNTKNRKMMRSCRVLEWKLIHKPGQLKTLGKGVAERLIVLTDQLRRGRQRLLARLGAICRRSRVALVEGAHAKVQLRRSDLAHVDDTCADAGRALHQQRQQRVARGAQVATHEYLSRAAAQISWDGGRV